MSFYQSKLVGFQKFIRFMSLLFKGAEATCVEISSEMKKCFRLKDILNFNVL